MKKLFILVLLGGFVLPSVSRAIDLKQAKFTQVVNSVDVISASDKSSHSAAVNDTFKVPDMLRTGPASRAELVAPDSTITRVGANTIFSFDPANRTIDLQQGSLLFHSPHGKGGGTIHTGSATASVLGTTIIVTTTPNGGFKVLVLEGQAEIRFLNGLHTTLAPGQMTFILPGGGTSPIVVFRLDQETGGSLLVNGFNDPLPSWGKIKAEITRQLLLLLNNKLQDTDLVVGDNATLDTVQVWLNLLGGQQPPPQPPSSPGSPPSPTPFDTDSSIIGSDHTPNQILPVNYSPLDPLQVEAPVFPSGENSFYEGLPFLGISGFPASGFVGNNIDIDTANVDLSAYAADPEFVIMAKNDMRIWQSVNFTAAVGKPVTPAFEISDRPGTIALFAGGRMLIAPGSTLEADTGIFGVVADSFGVLNTDNGKVSAANTLENVSFYNYIGDVDILSLSDLTIEGMDSYWTVFAGGSVDIQSDGTLNLGANSPVSGIRPLDTGHDVAIDAAGDVTLSAGLFTGGDLNVNNAEIYAGDNGNLGYPSYTGGSINMLAGGNIFVGSSYLSAYSGTTGSGGVNIVGGGNVGIDNSYIYADGDVNINSSGNTDIQYTDINQGGSINTAILIKPLISTGGTVYVTADGYVNLFDVYNDNYDYNSSDIYLNNWNIQAGSYTDIGADDNVQIYTSGIYAGGDVNITGGTLEAKALDGTYASGNISIGDSTIEAGDAQYASTGGSVNINTKNGGIYLYDDSIYAYGGDKSSGDVTINASGTVNIGSFGAGGKPSVNSGLTGISGGLMTISADGSVTIGAGTGLTVSSASISANTSSGTIELDSASGQTMIENGSSLQAYYINVNSPDGILLDGTSGGHVSGHTMNLTAAMGNSDGGSTVTLQNEDLSSFQTVNVQGHTLYLYGDTFNINIPNNFVCWNGTANIDNSSSPTVVIGSANFHDSYTMNGPTGPTTLISSQSQLNVTGGTTLVSTPGLNIIRGH